MKAKWKEFNTVRERKKNERGFIKPNLEKEQGLG